MKKIITITCLYFVSFFFACEKKEKSSNNPVNNANNGSPALHVFGGRVRAQILGLSLVDGQLWIGSGVAFDPADSGRLRSSLMKIDPDSGRVTDYEPLLPPLEYDFDGATLNGPAATAGVLQAGGRILAVSRAGLLEIRENEILTHPVVSEGSVVVPTGAAAGDGLFVTHERGISLLDMDTLEEIRHWTQAEIGNAWAHSPAAAPDGSLFCILVDADTGETSLAHVSREHLFRIRPADAGAASGNFTALAARPDRVEAYAALASWQPDTPALVAWNGEDAPQTLALESDLGDADTLDFDVFGPVQLALDAEQGVLAVGGGLQSGLTGLKGGGLLWFRLADGAMVRLDAKNSPFFAIHSGPIVMDSRRGITFASILQPCSDVQLGHLGLFALSFDAEKNLVAGRPLVSGVRALADGGGRLFAGMRDDNPGYACNGVPIAAGFHEIHANGWARLIEFSSADTAVDLPRLPSVTAAAQNPQGIWALGTWRDGLLAGTPESASLWNQAIEWGVSLYATSVFWESGNVLWLAGLSSHAPGDPAQLADAGPMGAVRIVFDAQGSVADARHFVSRIRPDLNDGRVVEGLPSGEVMQVQNLPDGRILLVCAAERMLPDGSDMALRPFFRDGDGNMRPGGLAAVDPETLAMEILSDPQELPDPQAAALLPDGRLLVLDASNGAHVLENGTWKPWEGVLPAGFPRALHPWRDGAAVLTDAAARVPGLADEIPGSFFCAAEVGEILYLGHAQGIVGIAPAGAAVSLPPYPDPAPIPFTP